MTIPTREELARRIEELGPQNAHRSIRRKSGRTTRLVHTALYLTAERGDVLIVVHNESMADHVWNIVRDVYPHPLEGGRRQGRFRVRVPVHDGTLGVVSARHLGGHHALPGVHVLWDHWARGEE